jgi:hypothetical protein
VANPELLAKLRAMPKYRRPIPLPRNLGRDSASAPPPFTSP